MTATGRAIVAVVALVAGVALIMLGAIVHDSGSSTAGVALTGPVLGYVFGDRNGEKRLASAMTVLAADQVAQNATTTVERHAVVAARAIASADADAAPAAPAKRTRKPRAPKPAPS